MTTATSSIITPWIAVRSTKNAVHAAHDCVDAGEAPRLRTTPQPYGTSSTVSSRCAQPLAIPAMYHNVGEQDCQSREHPSRVGRAGAAVAEIKVVRNRDRLQPDGLIAQGADPARAKKPCKRRSTALRPKPNSGRMRTLGPA